MAVSPTRAPLLPASTSQLNVKSADTDRSRKRKRTAQDATTPDDSIFTVKAVSSRQTPETTTFASVVTIARANLPLSWLNPASTEVQPPPGYVFTTNAALFVDEQNGVLVVRLCPNGGLYAIERANDTAYTAWPLLNWVSEELCYNARRGSVVSFGLEQLIDNHCGQSEAGSISSERPVQLPTPCGPKKAKNRRGAMARISILTPKEPMEESGQVQTCSQPLLTSPQDNPYDQGSNTPTSETPLGPDGQAPPPDEQLVAQAPILQIESYDLQQTTEVTTPARQERLQIDQLRQQYLDNLYLSKASLAFYAKGPLSRARADAKTPDGGFNLEALKEYYLTMIVPTKKIDVKYKDSISNIVKNLSAINQVQEPAVKPSRRKNTKKPKLGKDCLYTGEDELVAKWWDLRDFTPNIIGSIDAHHNDFRKAISELRNRETAMQLLLILEVLYIDKLLVKAAETVTRSTALEIKMEPVDNEATIPHEKPTRTKKRDLNSELDATAERLSIWHTVALEDILSSPDKGREGSDSSTAKSKDKLRDFCRDVIIPFYSAKLHEQAKSICRKLGGPEISPQRPRSSSSRSETRPVLNTSTKSKSRPAPKRPLERVLSEDQILRHTSPPILGRSSTAPLVPKLKREPIGNDSRPNSRSGMQKSVSFSNREIDLVADAKTHETKKRKLEKLATQKKELEEAIDALKKPNRSNAAKVFMDEIEKRNVDAKTTTKRSENHVHITATPRRAKSKTTSSQSAQEQYQSQLPSTEPMDPEPIVPSSTVKLAQSQPSLSLTSSKKKRAVLSNLHETPSRGLSKFTNPLAVIEATPAIDRLLSDLPTDTPLPRRLTTRSGKPVLFTPVKRNDINDDDAFMFRDVPEIPEEAGKAMDRVMGGKGIDESFSLSLSFHDAPSRDFNAQKGAAKSSESGSGSGIIAVKEKSIYQHLGWHEYDDL